ncbi:hypothetical protein B0H13DRAFT_1923508 [Mycena leptocephala]|nr:hypothetical protein B0H13DRAFT_1923508 [Mycena leptocephala]
MCHANLAYNVAEHTVQFMYTPAVPVQMSRQVGGSDQRWQAEQQAQWAGRRTNLGQTKSRGAQWAQWWSEHRWGRRAKQRTMVDNNGGDARTCAKAAGGTTGMGR